MLDIKIVREQPDMVKERLATRGAGDENRIDELLAVDEQRRKLIAEVEALKSQRNRVSKEIGVLMGQKKAQEVNRTIAPYIDVMIGNEEDFTACLGFKVEDLDESISHIETGAFKKMIETAVKEFPNFKVTATTLRAVKSASVNDWGAICWAGGKFYEAETRHDMWILDRVGGGDSFASGLVYAFLKFNDPQKAVDYGAAHGALAMTTPGDTSMATLKEVEALVGGGSARVQR